MPSPEILGEQLSLLVSTPSVDAIQLPPCRINSGELIIQRSVTFIGCPGAQLVVQNTPITIKSMSGSNINVRFIECSFSLEIPTKSCESQIQQTMIQINEGGTLELQDCQLKSESGNTNDSVLEHSQSMSFHQDNFTTCINLMGSAQTSDKIGSKPNTSAAQLLAHSCSFLYFSKGILAENNNLISIEKSGFIKIAASAIVTTNPQYIYIEGTNIENSGDCGIELRWTKPSFSDDSDREIKIVNNLIADCKEHGVSFSGIGFPFKNTISVTGNRFQLMHKDGIHLKDLAVRSFIISSNNINTVSGNGISIYRCDIPKLTIKANNIKNNKSSGIYLLNTSCVISSCECINNGLSGMVINGNNCIADKKDNTNSNITVSDCVFNENNENGISILDLRSGTILLEKCIMSGNHEYGLYLSKTSFLASPSPVENSPNTQKWSQVQIDHGEICYNKSGIYLLQQHVHIDKTLIKFNAELAINMPLRELSPYLDISTQTSAKKCIQGVVGGKWGSVGTEKRDEHCNCTICTVV